MVLFPEFVKLNTRFTGKDMIYFVNLVVHIFNDDKWQMFTLYSDDMRMCTVNEIPKQPWLRCKQSSVVEYRDNFEQLNERLICLMFKSQITK
jgi:hypothetical protein